MSKFIFILLILFSFEIKAQVCDLNVPTFYINFTGNLAGTTWTSPDTCGLGYCCSSSEFDRCINFIITTDSSTSSVLLSFYQPNPPIGSLNYKVDCGPLLVAGVDSQQIYTCGTHCITCCKPGNRALTYFITSIIDPDPTSCNSNSQCNNITSNFELEFKPSVSIFPNPFHNSTTLQTNIKKCELTIYNSLGTIVWKETINNPKTIVNRNSLTNGIYFYQITNENKQIYNGKLMVE